MHSWVFRHRHQLRAIYGLPPEERVQKLLDDHAAERRPKAERMALAGTIAAVEETAPEAQADGLTQIELRPSAKRV